jgi:hypothetical protein
MARLTGVCIADLSLKPRDNSPFTLQWAMQFKKGAENHA